MPSARSSEFIALIAWLTALTALSIDTMLPALGIMAHELGAIHENDRQFIILGMFGGMTFGNLIFGPLSDSIGRKPAIYLGLVLYAAGALICAVSWTFPMVIAGRVLQGFGAASPRTVAMSMVRDGAAGDAMARTMSFVMSVFMLVPILAPSVGQVVLVFAGWRWIFIILIIAAIIGAVWLWARQEETLRPENTRSLSVTSLLEGAIEVVRHPVSLGYTMAVGFIFGSFTTWLGTCQQIFAEQYNQGAYFAFWFGAMGVAIALSMIFNGRFVMKLGMRMLSKWALRGFVVNWAITLALSLAYGGQPPLVIAAVFFFASFFFSGMTFGNFNSMAMEPMGHIAGMASAITSFISGLMGVVLGGFAGRFYDGSLTPVALAFFVYGGCAFLLAEWAERGRARVQKSAS